MWLHPPSEWVHQPEQDRELSLLCGLSPEHFLLSVRGMPCLRSAVSDSSASVTKICCIRLPDHFDKPSRRSSRLETSSSMIRRTSVNESWIFPFACGNILGLRQHPKRFWFWQTAWNQNDLNAQRTPPDFWVPNKENLGRTLRRRFLSNPWDQSESRNKSCSPHRVPSHHSCPFAAAENQPHNPARCGWVPRHADGYSSCHEWSEPDCLAWRLAAACCRVARFRQTHDWRFRARVDWSSPSYSGQFAECPKLQSFTFQATLRTDFQQQLICGMRVELARRNPAILWFCTPLAAEVRQVTEAAESFIWLTTKKFVVSTFQVLLLHSNWPFWVKKGKRK